MDYVSVKVIDSAVAPGVRYHLHRLNQVRRAALRMRIAEPRTRLRALLDEADRIDSGDLRKLALLGETASALSALIDACHLRATLYRVEGLLIDGEPATPATFIAYGPGSLVDEAIAHAREMTMCRCNDQEAQQFNIQVN
jgi:hypothetical protein